MKQPNNPVLRVITEFWIKTEKPKQFKAFQEIRELATSRKKQEKYLSLSCYIMPSDDSLGNAKMNAVSSSAN